MNKMVFLDVGINRAWIRGKGAHCSSELRDSKWVLASIKNGRFSLGLPWWRSG